MFLLADYVACVSLRLPTRVDGNHAGTVIPLAPDQRQHKCMSHGKGIVLIKDLGIATDRHLPCTYSSPPGEVVGGGWRQRLNKYSTISC